MTIEESEDRVGQAEETQMECGDRLTEGDNLENVVGEPRRGSRRKKGGSCRSIMDGGERKKCGHREMKNKLGEAEKLRKEETWRISFKHCFDRINISH